MLFPVSHVCFFSQNYSNVIFIFHLDYYVSQNRECVQCFIYLPQSLSYQVSSWCEIYWKVLIEVIPKISNSMISKIFFKITNIVITLFLMTWYPNLKPFKEQIRYIIPNGNNRNRMVSSYSWILEWSGCTLLKFIRSLETVIISIFQWTSNIYSYWKFLPHVEDRTTRTDNQILYL